MQWPQSLKAKLTIIDSSVMGCDIGVNKGEDTHKTVFDGPVSLIPRRKNDVSNPIGGVRNLIPGKVDYKSN